MDLKELNEKLKNLLDVTKEVNEDINNPYTVQEFSLDILDAIEGLTAVKEMMENEDENFDEPSLKAIRVAERLMECVKKFRADLLDQRAAAWNTPQPLTADDEAAFGESVNESTIEQAPFNEGKIVKSDMLNFGIGINPTKDGFVLGTISYGSQIQPFRKEGATQEEVTDMVNRVASIVENHIDDIEHAIDRIGVNFGFRK